MQKRWVWFLLIAVVGLGAAAGGYFYEKGKADQRKAALQKQVDQLKKSSSPAATSTPTSTSTKKTGVSISETNYTLTLPAGWGHATSNTTSGDTGTSVDNKYTDDAGNYFEVLINPPGRDFNSDGSWTLTVKPGGKTLGISKEETCTASADNPFCSRGDGHLDLAGAATIGGSSYFFMFGNSKKEAGVELQVYRDIFASFKAK